VQQSRDETGLLFMLLAERYKRASVLISSGLPFSKWEEAFLTGCSANGESNQALLS
jgi:hypothetical protein